MFEYPEHLKQHGSGKDITTGSGPTYHNDIDPNTIFQNPEFLNDLHAEARERGVTLLDDKEAIDWFYDDRSWVDYGIYSTFADWYRASDADEESKARKARIRSVWEQTPTWLTNEADPRSGMQIAGDIFVPMLADPLNLIPIGLGAKATVTAGKAAVAAGKRVPAVRAALKGVTAGAKAGAGFGVGYGAAYTGAYQQADIDLGRKDEFDWGQAALDVGVETAAGAGLGGALGGLGAAALARQTARQAKLLQDRGISNEAIGSMTNKEFQELAGKLETSPEFESGPWGANETEELIANVNARYAKPDEQDALNTAELETAVDETLAKEMDPNSPYGELANQVDASMQIVSEIRNRLRVRMDQAQALNLTPEEQAELARILTQTNRLLELEGRLQGEAREISALAKSNDPSSIARADQRRKLFEQDFSLFRQLVLKYNSISNKEELVDDLIKNGFGAHETKTGGKTETQTEQTGTTTEGETSDETIVIEESEPAPADSGTAPKSDGQTSDDGSGASSETETKLEGEGEGETVTEPEGKPDSTLDDGDAPLSATSAKWDFFANRRKWFIQYQQIRKMLPQMNCG